MNFEHLLKSPVAWIVGVVVLVLVIYFGRGSSGASSSAADVTAANDQLKLALAKQSNDAALAASSIDSSNYANELASRVALTKSAYDNQLSLASVAAQKDVALANVDAQVSTTTLATTLDSKIKELNLNNQRATDTLKIQTDTALHQSALDYSHDAATQNADNVRVLGLATEETRRLQTTSDYTLGMTALDNARVLNTLSINSGEKVALDKNYTDRYSSDNTIKLGTLTSQKEVQLAQINGANVVAAVKANKPSGLSTFLGGLGKGLGIFAGGLFG